MASITHVLPILISHFQRNSEAVRFVCSVECVCSSWRAAVQALQESNCPLDVELEAGEATTAAWLSVISSFSCWLLSHTALVRSLSINKGTGEDAEQVATSTAGQQVLGTALLQAYSASDADAPAGPLVPQLQNYSSDCMGGSYILQALPAASITSLELHLPMHSRADPAFPSCQELSAAWAHLSNLQALSLAFAQQQVLSRTSCSALAGLADLTSLELGVQLQLDGVDALVAALSRLPLLQQLHLRCTFEDWQGLDLLPLLHLTELQLQLWGLRLSHSCPLQVPRQVQALGVRLDPACSWSCSAGPSAASGEVFPPIANMPELQQLQVCSLSTPHALPAFFFSQLLQLHRLSSISLGYQSYQAAQSNCQDWVQLSHLKRLSIASTPEASSSPAELAQLLCSIGAVTGLTGLKMCVSMPSWWPCAHAAELAGGAELDAQGMPLPLPVFQHLTGLKHLQELHLTLGPRRDEALSWQACVGKLQPAPSSAQDLTGLTNLTSLQLESFGSAVDDEAALALASCLTRLRHLDLRGCWVESSEVLGKLHRLPLLEELVLDEDEDEDAGCD